MNTETHTNINHITFSVGDRAVYPSHGVAVVERIESKEMSGSTIHFYVLKIEASGTTLMVPVHASTRVGMRNLLSKRDVTGVFDVLKSPPKNTQKAWNRRIKEFNDKLKTGSIYDVAEVTRDLAALGETKDLSFGEKKIFEKCMGLLANEISATEGRSSTVVKGEIDAMLIH